MYAQRLVDLQASESTASASVPPDEWEGRVARTLGNLSEIRKLDSNAIKEQPAVYVIVSSDDEEDVAPRRKRQAYYMFVLLAKRRAERQMGISIEP
ncbi:hypothetical protein CYMTET_48857 [Cymbomonas tetramitiformis]|uniref:Uncharacterized protein n=1 Tax=Cymbomonas tetramitiformis TaxID=36881 RepID=A0AAE0BRC3_9CHLO|nr:hypothetical protein CYMTET_48857 [Cymbomonas tetramitiformis]